jgi:uncharacterized protein DUF6422
LVTPLLLLPSFNNFKGVNAMSKSYPENLNAEQLEALEKAALLVIKARKEGAAMMARAGGESPIQDHFFGNPCGAKVDGDPCPCSNYTGDGGPCLTRVTFDPIATPIPHRSCGHKASQHLPT